MKYYIVRAGHLDLAFTSQAGAQKAMTVLMGAQELTRSYPDGYGEGATLNMKPLELAYRTEDLRPAGEAPPVKRRKLPSTPAPLQLGFSRDDF